VDYWNYLDWVDEFSDPAYTDRQERFAEALGSGSLYTPELVVNRTELSYAQATSVGAVTGIIDDFLGVEVQTSVTVWLGSAAGASPIVVEYMTDGAPAGAELTVILVEGGLSNEVTSGENQGETLGHENVARAFTTVVAGLESGQVELVPPDDLVVENARLIAFVQDPITLEYFGATGTPLAE